MGMFDSFYDADGTEWQTKAYDRVLDRWYIGDVVPGPPIDYQAEVIGGRDPEFQWKFATIRDGKLASAGDDRDPRLPLRLYSSGWEPARGETTGGRATPDREPGDTRAWILDEVVATHAGRASTHYEGCWRYHAGCLAQLLLDVEEKP